MMSLLYSKLFHLYPEEVIIRGERRVIIDITLLLLVITIMIIYDVRKGEKKAQRKDYINS